MSECVVVHNEAALEELFPRCTKARIKMSTVQNPVKEQPDPITRADWPKRKYLFSMDMCDDVNATSKLCCDLSTENQKYLTESEEHITSHELLKDYKRNNIYTTWNENVFIPLHTRIKRSMSQGSSKQYNPSQDTLYNEDTDANLWLTMQLQYINSDTRSRSRLRMKTTKNETSNSSISDIEIPHISRIAPKSTSLVLDN